MKDKNVLEVVSHNFRDDKNPVSIYISGKTASANIYEVEKDINDFTEFIEEKYKIKSTKVSFKEWIINKLKNYE